MTLIARLQGPAGRAAGRHGHLVLGLAVRPDGRAGAGLSGTATVPCPERPSRPTGGAGGQRPGSTVAAGRHDHRPDRNDFAAPSGGAAASHHRPAGTGRGDHRVSGQSRRRASAGGGTGGDLGERIESLRTTLQNVENDRTADLRHELRTIARLLARTGTQSTMPRRRESAQRIQHLAGLHRRPGRVGDGAGVPDHGVRHHRGADRPRDHGQGHRHRSVAADRQPSGRAGRRRGKGSGAAARPGAGVGNHGRRAGQGTGATARRTGGGAGGAGGVERRQNARPSKPRPAFRNKRRCSASAPSGWRRNWNGSTAPWRRTSRNWRNAMR